MILFPAVKKFIEENIKIIEESDVDVIISEAAWNLTDSEFTQLYHILTDDIELKYDLDEPIHDYIRSTAKDIIKENNEERNEQLQIIVEVTEKELAEEGENE